MTELLRRVRHGVSGFGRSLSGFRPPLSRTVVAIALVGVGASVGMLISPSTPSASSAVAPQAGSSPSSSPAPADRPSGMTEYTDQKLGFKVAYPSSWRRVDVPPDSLVLDAGDENAVSIRRFSLAAAIDAANLAQIRAVTDGILGAPDAKLTILQTEQVKVGNLLGIYYLYYFPLQGTQGVHAHYFLFNGKTMYTLVFQSGGATEFQKIASVFDSVSTSFQPISA